MNEVRKKILYILVVVASISLLAFLIRNQPELIRDTQAQIVVRTSPPVIIKDTSQFGNLGGLSDEDIIILAPTSDNNGAIFTYDNDSSATVDSIKVFNGPNSVGRFVRFTDPLGINNVTDWGAAGDDLIEDTTDFQAAIDALSAGDVLEVPQGTYLVNVLTINTADITIRGEGAILKATGVNSDIIQIQAGGDRCKLIGLELDGNDSRLLGVRILDNAEGCQLINLDIHNFDETDGNTIDLIQVGDSCDDTLIQGCHLRDATSSATIGPVRGIRFTGNTAAPQGCRVVGNTIENLTPVNDSDGIVAQDYPDSIGLMITGNTIRNCAKRALKVNTAGVSFVGNHCIMPNAGGGADPHACIQIASDDTIISGNVIDMVDDGATDSFIEILLAASNITITGNQFLCGSAHGNTNMDGVIFTGTTHNRAIVSGNLFEGDVRDGISIDTGTTLNGLTADGNVFDGVSDSGRGCFVVLGTLVDGVISNSVARNINAAGYFLTGNGTFTRCRAHGNQEDGSGLAQMFSGIAAVLCTNNSWSTLTATDDDASPEVQGVETLIVNNSVGTTITDFVNGASDHWLRVHIIEANTGISSSGTVNLDSAAGNYTAQAGGAMFVFNTTDGTNWYEVSRRVY